MKRSLFIHVSCFKNLHKRLILLFFWSCIKVASSGTRLAFILCRSQPWIEGFLAWNMLSVICQRNAELPLNPHLQAWAQQCPRCSRAWCGPSLKTVEALLLQQIDEVYLERRTVKVGKQRARERNTERRRSRVVMDFSSLKGISCYMWDVLCGRLGKNEKEYETDKHHSAIILSLHRRPFTVARQLIQLC